MAEIKNAPFSIKDFKIPNFSYNLSKRDLNVSMKIDFDPHGTYIEDEGIFLLNLIITGTEDIENGALLIEINSFATFQFEKGLPFNDIPDFFYVNSTAIFFPYLRAFISTMSLQANMPLVILNTFNFVGLSSVLKSNTMSFGNKEGIPGFTKK